MGSQRRRLLVCFAVVFATLLSVVALASPRVSNDYGVFCVKGRITLDMRCIEEMKSAFGSDVCRLDQDQTEAGANDKAARLGGPGAPCSCD